MTFLKRNDTEFQKFCKTTLPTLHSWSEVIAWCKKHGVRFNTKAMHTIHNRLRRTGDRTQRRSAQRHKRVGEMPAPAITRGLTSLQILGGRK